LVGAREPAMRWNHGPSNDQGVSKGPGNQEWSESQQETWEPAMSHGWQPALSYWLAVSQGARNESGQAMNQGA